MTIRIITLSVFALLCFTVGGIIAPHLSFAADDGVQTAQNPTAQPPADGHPGKGAGSVDPQKRQQLREELMKLPPDQRKAKIQELKQQMNDGRAQKLEQRKAEFQSKWDKASPEQRAKFCSNVQQKCASGAKGAQFACTVAKTKCEGQ